MGWSQMPHTRPLAGLQWADHGASNVTFQHMQAQWKVWQFVFGWSFIISVKLASIEMLVYFPFWLYPTIVLMRFSEEEALCLFVFDFASRFSTLFPLTESQKGPLDIRTKVNSSTKHKIEADFFLLITFFFPNLRRNTKITMSEKKAEQSSERCAVHLS